ncbi:ABC transporter permease [Rhizobium wenxiniae]|uniref:Putative spermidine/putrescine transport system permease protein n=1 Tax=Rhizobium wenxiniae TaxID=1737357 RepID=A0A7X0D1Q1_9HYPH|nr:ABC transporter permease [Rhizobium wenxiniae]MBB6163736.1 putative spermidine/putrescine transport system permease protein [Rhizobium wenxiniae]GGG12707.1 ABC transporter permease [Rhizobium wenxiniae]
MSGKSFLQKSGPLLLVAPLFLFICLFFIWPLGSVLTQSVSDNAVARLLPETAKVASSWDGQSAPAEGLQAAFVTDLRAATDEQAVGDMVRRLNSAQSGFRTLMSKTLKAVQDKPEGPIDLVALDRKWSQPQYWKAITDALSPTTDRYLLAAVDLMRNDAGEIISQPPKQTINVAIFGRTFWISATVTIFCVLLGYPYALLITVATGWKKQALLAAVLLPLWTSLLVRTAAWFILLQEQGLINSALMDLNIIADPLALIFNRTGVIIAMTHVSLPMMVLPIYSVLLTIPKNLMPAAASLGAHPLRAFVRVLLPLSFGGIAAGSLLVFMSAIGYYITPALIGGAGDQMISSFIAFHAQNSGNWGMASALGIVLLVVTIILYAVYERLATQRERSA